jgi:AcrR family transcriptional regulator
MSPRIDVTALRREQIVEAVRHIISAEGLDAVTIARIADVADVSPGVITYHYENKSEILQDAFRAAMQDANREVKSPSEDDGTTDLPAFTRRVVELATSDNDWWRIYVAFLAQAQKNEDYGAHIAKTDERYRLALANYVGSPARATLALALMKGLALQLLVSPAVLTDETIAETRALFGRWLAQTDEMH